ncbi:OmpA family protein [Tamlana sp. 2_MG-2023]|uniref:OmpA family protein n=1 Tax=unclassified Tamlana TaxID=2614803 RepID=UPI0026E20C3C|nr:MULTISPECIES: OmpA family protein [unclassified Tamlana]MDO6760814.1 OmpA family protein [Tamlana sp. 2_MG-2023]MDO6791070.1 OmpA family protein [Tamlana sp. 1_MG-2023]
MRKIITLFIFCSITCAFAQDSNTQKADRLFDKMWYKEAAVLYEKEVQKIENGKPVVSQEQRQEYFRVLKRAGDAHYFNTDMENAFRYYDDLVSKFNTEVPAEYIFRYVHTLEGTEKYSDAKYWMKEFANRAEANDDRSEEFSQAKVKIEDILAIEPHFLLKNLSINTKFSDFGAMYYNGQLVYSSADSSNFHTRLYQWNKQPYLNFFIGNLDQIQSDATKVGEFSKDLNTKYHEASIAFSPDESVVYFTRNNYDGKLGRDGKGTNNLKIYRAEHKKGKDSLYGWKNIKELPFNSDDYSVGHPAVSPDGKKLYFVSDMPGTIGGTDIFVVDILGDDDYVEFSKPRNLGEKINTPAREMFPFVTENALFFASDGHLGLGGLDVFESIIKDSTYQKPTNLGAPLNSDLDDFSFIINEETNRGFVSSNRLSGKGDDDIYSFIRESITCEQLIRGHVANTVTGETISSGKLVLCGENGTVLDSTLTDLNGRYKFDRILPCATHYNIEVSKEDYEPRDKAVITLAQSGETIVPLGLAHKLIVKEDGLLKIKINNIYFDLDKSNIKPGQATDELNKIVKIMNEYPKMHIKIESHTDSRASDAYNLALSDRRAKSTRDYIISQGIEANRIESAIGYGETQLLNKCSNGVPCTSEEHQLNRRSEFIILKRITED